MPKMPQHLSTTDHKTQAGEHIYQYRLRVADLDIEISDMVYAMGYETGHHRLPQYYVAKIKDVLRKAEKNADIRVGFRLLPPEPFHLAKTKFSYDGIEFRTGKIIAAQLKQSESVALFAGTAGDYFDRWANQLFDEGDFPGGFVADCAGSEIVERAIDWLEARIADRLRETALGMTNRFSPGYCGWNVEEQHKLFSLLPPDFLGIHLTDSALMVPIKSVSGVIGLGKQVKKAEYPCSICDMKDCYRRRKYHR